MVKFEHLIEYSVLYLGIGQREGEDKKDGRCAFERCVKGRRLAGCGGVLLGKYGRGTDFSGVT